MNNNDKINAFIQKCRTHHLSVTPQRLAIYRTIADDHSHPNPESIYKRIKEEFPTISFATVYKTLETFEKYGIISMVTTIHNTVRYDPITKPHHHAICVRCKKIFDIFDDQLDRLPVPAAVTDGHKLLNFAVQFNIICADCLAKEKNR